MYSRCRSSLALALAVALLCASGCQREQRAFTVNPASSAPPPTTPVNTVLGDTANATYRQQMQQTYEANAYQVSQGQELYSAFNCVGCHAHGGGDIGPALMDEKWIYGGEIDQIYLSIAQGRANGMPAFGGMIPSQQIWQIAAYVRSMGGHGPKSARANRQDHMATPVPAEASPAPVKSTQREEG
jgi:cytochrome c oxidase cbb3-type subunit 3